MKPSDSQRTQVVLEQAPQKQSAFNIKNIFKVDQTIGVSIFRLYLLSGLGIRYPLKMLPLLIMQLVYKSIWVLAVGLTLRSAGQMAPAAAELFSICSKGLVVDLIIIPWPYVLANYFIKPGDQWI